MTDSKTSSSKDRRRRAHEVSAERRRSNRARAVEHAREERAAKQAAVMEQLEEVPEAPLFTFPEVKVDLKAEVERLKNLRRFVFIRRCMTLASVVLSAFIQAYTIQAFVNPANLLSSGFTGLAILIDRITSLFGFSFPTFVGMVALNIPRCAHLLEVHQPALRRVLDDSGVFGLVLPARVHLRADS